MKTSKIVLSVLATACLNLSGLAVADETNRNGYLLDSRGELVKSGAGLCWHTGFWTPADAIVECDPDLVKKEVVADKKPAPAVVAAVKAPTPTPAITLTTDALFDYDKANIRSRGKTRLDTQVVDKIKEYARVGVILVTGHADRIGKDGYNQTLSQQRADAVKDYLIEHGVAADRIETAAKGSSEPLVSCDTVPGKIHRSNTALVECLQPNRRVVVEVKVQKPL
ncbi:MAG: OmpA family protein [Gallionella sp.]|nr:OmpA family protein [Gallionella sp.]